MFVTNLFEASNDHRKHQCKHVNKKINVYVYVTANIETMNNVETARPMLKLAGQFGNLVVFHDLLQL